MGVTKILAVARNPELLEEVRKLAPSRILVHPVQDGPIEPWAYQVTDGDGVDLVIDCLGPGSPGSAMIDAMSSLRPLRPIVNVAAVADILTQAVHPLIDRTHQIMSYCWLTTHDTTGSATMVQAPT